MSNDTVTAPPTKAGRDDKGNMLPGYQVPGYVPQKRKYSTPEQLHEKLTAFDAFCKEYTKPKTVERLCVFLGISRQTLLNYENEFDPGDSGEALMLDMIKQVRGEILADRVDDLVDMKNRNAAGSIFLLKNSHGFKDRIDHAVEVNSHLHIHISDSELEQLQSGTVGNMAQKSIDAQFSVKEG